MSLVCNANGWLQSLQGRVASASLIDRVYQKRKALSRRATRHALVDRSQAAREDALKFKQRASRAQRDVLFGNAAGVIATSAVFAHFPPVTRRALVWSLRCVSAPTVIPTLHEIGEGQTVWHSVRRAQPRDGYPSLHSILTREQEGRRAAIYPASDEAIAGFAQSKRLHCLACQWPIDAEVMKG